MSQYSDFVKGYANLHNLSYQQARKEQKMIELYNAHKRIGAHRPMVGDNDLSKDIDKVLAKIKELGLQ